MNKLKNGHSEKKAFLAKRLRMEKDDRFEVVWESLADRGIIEDWERGATSAEDVVDDAKQLLHRFRTWEGHASSSTRQTPEGRAMVDVPVEPSEREKDMTAAFREYLAVHAAQRPIVQRFRREYLPDGRLLTDDHDIALLLDEQKVGWRAETTDVQQYLDDNLGKPDDWVVHADLSGKPPTGDVSGFGTTEGIFRELLRLLSGQERDMQEDWWGKGRNGQEDISWQDFLDGEPTEEDVAEERREQQKGYEGYFGAQLETLGSWLAAKYPWKGVGDAVVFLISGRPPRLAETAEPLSATDNIGHATHSLTFSPWISEKTIVRAFRVLRGRSPGDKTVRVLRFVSGQADEEGRLPSWPALLNRWNAANPDEKYSDRSALSKAYTRAVDALVPPYLLPTENAAT
jgi:hypothetical protein